MDRATEDKIEEFMNDIIADVSQEDAIEILEDIESRAAAQAVAIQSDIDRASGDAASEAESEG
jgi:hypothetical protein